MKKLLTQNELAKALGRTAQQIGRERKRAGKSFPSVKLADGSVRFDLEKVRAFRKGNIRMRKPHGAAAEILNLKSQISNDHGSRAGGGDESNGEGGETPAAVMGAAEKAARKILESADASAMELARAAVTIASVEVIKQVSPTALDALKKSLAELRQSEADYLDLAERRGELIERTAVREIVGACCARLVRCCERLELTLGAEVEIWLEDGALKGMAAAERGRKVRAFVGQACNEVRAAEAQEVDVLIAKSVEKGE